jgi:general secretion pathway protein G
MDMAKSRAGFTLVEISFTVLVLGILASIASLAIINAVTDSRIKTAEIELELIGTATLQLAWDTGQWPNQAVRTRPGSTEIWDISGDAAGLLGSVAQFTGWKGPYYEGQTVDPWGNPYFFDPDYLVSGVNRIVVGSLGPDGLGKNVYGSGTGKDNIYILLDD